LYHPIPAEWFFTDADTGAPAPVLNLPPLQKKSRITIEVQSSAEYPNFWNVKLSSLAEMIRIDSWRWTWGLKTINQALQSMGIRKRVFGCKTFRASIAGIEFKP
jgi:hypothetical protein